MPTSSCELNFQSFTFNNNVLCRLNWNYKLAVGLFFQRKSNRKAQQHQTKKGKSLKDHRIHKWIYFHLALRRDCSCSVVLHEKRLVIKMIHESRLRIFACLYQLQILSKLPFIPDWFDWLSPHSRIFGTLREVIWRASCFRETWFIFYSISVVNSH